MKNQLEDSDGRVRELEQVHMKIQDDYRVMRQLNKEQKQEKRNIENELLRERARTD